MLLALPLLALCIWWAVRRSLMPLVKLSHLLQSKPAGDVELIQIDHHSKELQALIDSLNQHYKPTQAYWSRRRVLRRMQRMNFARRLQRSAYKPVASQANEQEQQQALSNMLIACDRANRTIEQLLTLARLDQSAALQTETVDLAELTRQIMSDLAVKALSIKASASMCNKISKAHMNFSTKANATLIGVLLRNLIDNAIRYCPQKVPTSNYRSIASTEL